MPTINRAAGAVIQNAQRITDASLAAENKITKATEDIVEKTAQRQVEHQYMNQDLQFWKMSNDFIKNVWQG